jgi:hypothetical protein
VVPWPQLRDFLITSGAKIVGDFAIGDPIVTRFTHYEDATPGAISWHRHFASEPYAGSVLMLQRAHGYGRRTPHLVVTRRNMRALVSETIQRFFACDDEPRIAPAAPRRYKGTKL